MKDRIDITFDFRSDSGGKDPDKYSPTLKRYHRILWSKEVPAGGVLDLDENLEHHSELGDFVLSSDSVVHTFSSWKRYQHIIEQVPKEKIDDFVAISYTIGGMTVFPANVIDGKSTINRERGFNRKICDRIDLTLECIRLYYQGKDSPLYECFCRYKDFFDLFVDFKGYVEFFMFQDMVNEDYTAVEFFHPFDSFEQEALPGTVDEYLKYRERAMEFVRKRNERIEKVFGG